MQNRWELPDNSTLYTSMGYGIFNRTDNEMSFGVTWVKDNFNIAAGYKNAWIKGNKNPITYKAKSSYLPALFDNYRESNAYNVSMGYQFENFKPTWPTCIRKRPTPGTVTTYISGQTSIPPTNILICFSSVLTLTPKVPKNTPTITAKAMPWLPASALKF